jgi:hypothetical protein
MDEQLLINYKEILEKGKTLKCPVQDFFDLIDYDKDLSAMNSQAKRNIKKDIELVKKLVDDHVGDDIRIISKYIGKDKDKILYWCMCDFKHIFYLCGMTRWIPEKSKYWIERIEKDEQKTFLGKDIKKAFNSVTDEDLEGNKFLKQFMERFIDTDKPIGDGIYYSIFFSKKDNEIKCVRNVELSPRPVRGQK